MTKPVKRVDLSKLTPDQRAAFVELVRDCQTFSPQMQEMKQAAQAVFSEFVKQPAWGVADGESPENAPPQDLWHIGAPEVNYVDHIERPQET